MTRVELSMTLFIAWNLPNAYTIDCVEFQVLEEHSGNAVGADHRIVRNE